MRTVQDVKNFISEKGRELIEEKANEAYTLFLKPNQQDQHNLFAEKLGIERNEAKQLYYYLLYSKPEKLSPTMNLMVMERYILKQYSKKLTQLGVTKIGKEILQDLADDEMSRVYRSAI